MKPFYVSLKPFVDHGSLSLPADWTSVFGRKQPLEVEIGFGNGEYLAGLSGEFPSVNFIGFEEYCERIHRTLRKLSRTGLDNARVMRLDARAGFERYIAPRSIGKIHCLYPPPWPKKSDAKHRLFTPEFLRLVNSRLTDGGVLKIVTDYKAYIEWVLEQVPETGFHVESKVVPASYGTKFEKKWVEGGQKEFYELLLTKTRHVDVPQGKDVAVQTYRIDHFDPDKFSLGEYSKDGIAVAYRDMLYDPKKKMGLVHVIATEGHITQHVRILIVHTLKGWYIKLAEGTLLMPNQAVAKALELVHEAVLSSGAKDV